MDPTTPDAAPGKPGRFRLRALLGLIVGLAIIAALLASQDLAAVFGFLAVAGWAMLLVCLIEPPGQWLGAEAWRVLFPAGRRPGVMRTFLASWIGMAVNILLPVGTIGGEVVKARLLTLWTACAVTEVVATTIVDKTVQAIAVLLWGLVGMALLAAAAPSDGLVIGLLAGAGLLLLGIAAFVAVQVAGSFSFVARGVARLAGSSRWSGLVTGAGALDGAVRALYSRPGPVLRSVFLRVVQRVWLVGDVLLAAYLMGQPLSLDDAIMLKAIAMIVRSMAFAVPAGLGVQEGTFVAVGAVLGLAPDFTLSLSLATRVREFLPSLPMLLVWQHAEGRALWRRRRATAPADSP